MKSIIQNNMIKLRSNIIIIGASSIIAQLLFFREIYSVVYGNELIFGIMLSLWLMLSGVGTYIGKYLSSKAGIKSIQFLHLLLALLPIISVLGIRFSRAWFFGQGVMMDLPETTIFSLLWTAPYCLAAGIALIQYSSVLRAENASASVYILDLTGGAIGGLIFYFVFLLILDSFDALIVILFLNIFAAFLLNTKEKHQILIRLTGIIIIVISIILITTYKERSIQVLYPDQEIMITEDTPYGRLLISKTEQQYNFFEDGTLLFSTNSVIENEESIHYALSQLDSVRNVLLISGGIAGMTDEVLKYNIKKLDYTEINSAILNHHKFSKADLSDKRISIHRTDGRRFLKNHFNNYNAIIINVPSPSNAQLNRYYTEEFFLLAKNALSPNGVLSLQLPATANYLSSEQALAQSVIFNTLSKVFQNIIIIPGSRNYFLASDKILTYNIIPSLIEKNIDNDYVNQYYYDLISTESRAEYIISNLDSTASINRDFQPFAYFSEINYRLSYFGEYDIFILIIFIIPLILFAIKSNPVSYGLFAGGFAASSVQFILIFSFQVIYGFAYEFIAIIFSVFMLGLALGAGLNKIINKETAVLYRNLLLFLTAYIIALPIIIKELAGMNNDFFIIAIFILLILIISIMGGLQFPVAGRLISDNYVSESRSIAGQSFSADYFGASLGAIVTSVLLLPIAGIANTNYIIAAILLTAYILVIRKK